MVEGVRAPGMDKVALTAGETDCPSHVVEEPCARNPVKPETRRSNRPRGGDGLVRSESVHAQSGWGGDWPRPDRQCGQHGNPSGGGDQVGDTELNAASALLVTLKEARKALGRDMLERVLKTHGGKVTAAAQELGISPPGLLRTDGEAGHRQGWLKVRRGFGVF